jgi:hypothetical protein
MIARHPGEESTDVLVFQKILGQRVFNSPLS